MDPVTNDPNTNPPSTNTPPEPTTESAPPVTPENTTSVKAGPAGPAGPVVGGADNVAPVAPVSGSGRFKKILTVVVIVLIVGIGAAAAYVGVVLPNKPINVLKQSLANSLQTPQSSFKGAFESNTSASGGMTYKANFSGAADTTSKKIDFKLNFTTSGVTFPIEARLIDKNVYVKPGDLSAIADLAGAYSPGYATLAKTLSSQLSNKWIVIDSTLLGKSASCLLDTSWSVTNADVQLLNKVYDKNAFVDIKSTSGDSVNGQKAEKYVLSIDNDKAVAFDNDKTLNDLSLAKSTQKCDKNASDIVNAKGDHKQTPLTVWIDKGAKRIVKIAYQDPTKKNSTLEITFSYGQVSIDKPANATPAIQVLTQIEQAAAADPALLNALGATTGDTGASAQ